MARMSRRRKKNNLPNAKDQGMAEREEQLAQALAFGSVVSSAPRLPRPVATLWPSTTAFALGSSAPS
jgi:hypothetical protein